jgi:SAM-dependent MidA family methyltransferase
VRGDRFVRVEVPVEEDLAAALRPAIHEDERAVPTGALRLIDEVAYALRRGYALFVDYGGDADAGGGVHGYRDHRLVEDVLVEPGTTDITAGVDFGLLAGAASAAGLRAFPTVRQLRALSILGFADWMRDELAAQGSLLNRGEGMEAVRRWAGRGSASILVDAGKLGRLRWFLLASPDLPRPSFLAPEEQDER